MFTVSLSLSPSSTTMSKLRLWRGVSRILPSWHASTKSVEVVVVDVYIAGQLSGGKLCVRGREREHQLSTYRETRGYQRERKWTASTQQNQASLANNTRFQHTHTHTFVFLSSLSELPQNCQRPFHYWFCRATLNVDYPANAATQTISADFSTFFSATIYFAHRACIHVVILQFVFLVFLMTAFAVRSSLILKQTSGDSFISKHNLFDFEFFFLCIWKSLHL